MLALSVDIDHSSIQHTDPKLQHDTPQLIVGVGGGASHERQVVGVAVLEPSRSKECQGAEVHVGNTQKGLQEGEPCIRGSNDHHASVHLDFVFAQQLLGDHRQSTLRPLRDHLLALLPLHLLFINHLFHLEEARHLRGLALLLLECRRPPRGNLQHVPEDGRHGLLQVHLQIAYRPTGQANSLLEHFPLEFHEQRVDDKL
mmetsp:Transcript_15952/g.35185  ORF Transcript_15952/g.35185 Transcript_15952/m.35185 type:complete len:200 (-) Transcript_15952:720-1319(-)